MTQKISEWLSDCGSHEIYAYTLLVADFEKCTELKFPDYVRKFTAEQTRATMDARGLGGTLTENPERWLIYGHAMAEDFAANLVQFHSNKIGRGRIFNECIAAIAKAGL